MGEITVVNLGKAYRSYSSRWARLAEWMIPNQKPRHELKWVLEDVSFKIKPGEAVGIVGINGAGKSTLLKVIAGTIQPTNGSVSVRGRVAALLELGMGFHSDFTGRQNVFMAGQLLGHSVDSIARLMPEIEAFAEIGEYIDQPVRVYSSGMQVRLAFSVATAVRPDVLIVDEALSVGDKYFSQKSFGRIQSFLDQGTTLLFVSHDATAVKALCDRAILMEKGRATMIADPESVIDRYHGLILDNANGLSNAQRLVSEPKAKAAGSTGGSSARQLDGFRETHAQVDTGEIRLVDFQILDATGQKILAVTTGEEVCIKYRVQALVDLDDLYFGISIRNSLAISIFNTNSCALEQQGQSLRAGEVCEISYSVRLPIQVGNYGICMGVAARSIGGGMFEKYLLNVINAEVLEVVGNGQVARFGGYVDLAPAFSVCLPVNN